MRTFLMALAVTRVRNRRKCPDGGATAKPAPVAPSAHVLLTPGDMKWGPAPPVLPSGAQVTVLDGDPFKPGFFSFA